MRSYDNIIIGAGIYGLYAATLLKGKTAIIEIESEPFSRASSINQARVHNGYHYPRSLETAVKAASYFERFVKDFSFSINNQFEKIYAIAAGSRISADNFIEFCKTISIPLNEVDPTRYFKKGLIEKAFIVKEYGFDANRIRNYLLGKIDADIYYGAEIKRITGDFNIHFDDQIIKAEFILNTTYASINQLNALAGKELFDIKYELCEMISCHVPALTNIGLTVMDGPFFSVMPFGFSQYHTLSCVNFTPRLTCHNILPIFSCQWGNPDCTKVQLKNCNICEARPATTWTQMNKLAAQYLKPDIKLSYFDSLYSIKPILKSSEADDSRPTVIMKNDDNFYSVLSGKITSIYDLNNITIMKIQSQEQHL